MTPDQAMWEDELARANADLENAKKYDDQGSITWAEERIRWAKIKIQNFEDYEKHMKRKKGA